MVEVENLEFQNETQGTSTPKLRANNARNSSAQDDRGWMRSGCLDHEDSEFETMLRVLAEC
jgi:hypothetical protein